jgi:hypothetical protein
MNLASEIKSVSERTSRPQSLKRQSASTRQEREAMIGDESD